MLGNSKKTIGVFVSQAYQEYQDMLSRGIISRARDLDYNVAFFTNFPGYGDFNYEAGEKCMADFPMYEDLDGIILLKDTMHVAGFEQTINENIRKYSHCPVVSVRRKMDEYLNVLIDDNMVLDEIMHHLIRDHGYRKINILTGPKDNPVSYQRLDSYKRILSEYGLPVEEDRIYFGDFWKYAANNAIDKWFSDPMLIPEAIVCGNDYMAITVCNILASRGYKLPYDIAITGFDNIEIAEDISPAITTASMPVFEMGVEAVNKIYKHNLSVSQEKDTYLQSITHIRESCGCSYKKDPHYEVNRRSNMIQALDKKDKAILNNAYMSIDLTGVSSIKKLASRLASYTYMNEGYSYFFMCLNNGWDVYIGDERKPSVITDEVTMEVGIRDGEWLEQVKFNRRDMLPPEYIKDEPQFFFFNMLHHLEKCYGYTAISFHEPQTYKSSYQGWLINICNTLENIKIQNEMNRLVYKLEDMYIRDEMTGLCNRRAIKDMGKSYLERSRSNKSLLMVFSADMDNLKYINDNFGHSAGDKAIKAVADALMEAARDDEICIRMGGDEFAVIGIEYTEARMEEFIRTFNNYITVFNRECKEGFYVMVSYGYYMLVPDEETDLEECINIADARMYQQKYNKEAIRLKKLEQKADYEKK